MWYHLVEFTKNFVDLRSTYLRRSSKYQLKEWVTYTGHVVWVADTLWHEPVSDFPGENGRTFPLVFGHFLHNTRRGDPGLGTAYRSGLDVASLVIPENDENHIGQVIYGIKALLIATQIIHTFQVFLRRIHWRLGGFLKYHKVWPHCGPTR